MAFDDFAGARIDDRRSVRPAARGAMHPLNNVVAQIHQVRAFGHEFDAKGVLVPGGFKRLIPPARTFKQRGANRLGRAAINYYKQDPASGGVSPLSLPAPPPRRRLVAGLVAAGIALGALAAVIPLGFYSRTLPLGGLVLAEVGLVLTMLRLIRITRPQKAT